MQRVVLINYANDAYKKAQHLNTWTGRHIGGFSEVIEYGPEGIDPAFYEANRYILDQKRGNGEWLWKPYFLLKTLEQLKEGDIVFYCDAGAFFCRNFRRVLLKTMGENDIWVSNLPLIEKQWTKPAVFEALWAYSPEVKETNQIQGGFIGVRKTEESVAFIRRWLDACSDPKLIMPLREDEMRGECLEHREDQSILSVLCKMEGICPHKDPSQYGRIPEKYYAQDRLFRKPENADRYPACVVLHRKRDAKFSVCLKQWLCAWLPLPLVYRLSAVKKIEGGESV